MVTKLGPQANLEERFEDLLASRGVKRDFCAPGTLIVLYDTLCTRSHEETRDPDHLVDW